MLIFVLIPIFSNPQSPITMISKTSDYTAQQKKSILMKLGGVTLILTLKSMVAFILICKMQDTPKNGPEVAKMAVLGCFAPLLTPKWGEGGQNQIVRFKP